MAARAARDEDELTCFKAQLVVTAYVPVNAGYVALKPGWPDDPETVAEAQANPEVFAGKSVGQVADHIDASTAIRLSVKP